MRNGQDDLKSLDGLIARIGGSDDGNQSAGPCGLLLEHLQAARRDLMGSMSTEYRLSLRQAAQSLACVPDEGVRDEVGKSLRDLMDSTKSR